LATFAADKGILLQLRLAFAFLFFQESLGFFTFCDCLDTFATLRTQSIAVQEVTEPQRVAKLAAS
jgi:hypothetical protein